MSQLPDLLFKPFGGPPSPFGYQVASRKFLMFTSYLGELKCTSNGDVVPPAPHSPDIAWGQHTHVYIEGTYTHTRVLVLSSLCVPSRRPSLT